MSLRFSFDNLVKTSTITASQNDAQFPSSNLKDDRRTKIYKSTSNSCNIVFDFGSTKPIDTVTIIDSSSALFDFGTATIQFNATNVWTSPAVSQALTIDTVNGWANFNWSSVQNYRYARLVLTRVASGPMSLSKIFIGSSVYFQDICFGYPITYKQNNRATSTQNRYGQKFFDEVNTQRELSGEIPTLNKNEMDSILQILDYASFTKPIWLNFDALNFLNQQNRVSGYYYLTDDPSLSLQVGNFWNVAMSFAEGM